MKIDKVIPKKDYTLTIEFKNNKVVCVDCLPLISNSKGLGRELHDYNLFKKVKVDDFGGIYWPNGFDICPDVIENPELVLTH